MHAAPFANVEVIVVEDDFSLGKIMESQLQTLGYKPTLVNSADLALEHFRRKRFNILLTDIRLGGKNGFELAKQVRSHDSQVAIIFLTGKPDEKGVREAQKMGAIQYITKPVTMADLSEQLGIAARWNIAQLIMRSAEKYLTVRQDRRGILENKLQRAKADLKNIIMSNRDAKPLIELAYSRSPGNTELYHLLDAKLGPYLSA